MSADDIVARLEKGDATVKEIGTNNPMMYALEKAGVVRKTDKTKKTSKGRGRPAVVWTLGDKSKIDDASIPGNRGRGGPEQVKAMHEGKRKAAAKREKDALKKKRADLKQLKIDVPALEPKYDKALKLALKKNTKVLWSQADSLQNGIISGNRRIRELESELGSI